MVDTGDGQVLWRRVGGSGPGKGRENRGNLWGKLENHCFLSSVNLLEIGLNLNWLVVWNMTFMTFHSVGNVIFPTDEVIFFRRVGIPPTSEHEMWVNYIDLTVLPNPRIMVHKGNHPYVGLISG